MLEPDVRLKAGRPSDILARFPGPDQVDLLAGRLRPAGEDWDWGATMDPAAGPVWRCLFAVTRLSTRAIDLLYDARRRASAEHLERAGDPALWPNDEAFVASTIARSSLTLGDLNDFGQVYEDAGFSFWFALSERELEATGREGFIYHPVLSGQAYFIKLCRLAVREGAVGALEEIIERLTGVEWSPEEARGHRLALDFLRPRPPPLAAE